VDRFSATVAHGVDYMSMRILMTGATGFLGSHLLARLLAEPQFSDITILKRSYSDLGRVADLMPVISSFDLDLHPLEEIFERNRFDTILHCATNYGRGPIPRAQIIETNLLLPLRLLDLSADHGTTLFINTDTMLDNRISAYSLSKQQFREWLRGAAERMTCIDMLLEHFYGPGDDQTKFVSYLIGALLERRASIDLTAGMQTRDFTYIQDVTDAFLHVLRSAQTGGGYLEYQVGSGQSTRLKDFVELARTICGNSITELRFGALAYRANEQMNVSADTSRLRALGWRSSWSVRAGLETTVREEKAANGQTGRRRVASPAFVRGG
jgi:CDP-paratose synthetase